MLLFVIGAEVVEEAALTESMLRMGVLLGADPVELDDAQALTAVTPVVVYVLRYAPKQGVIVGVGPQASMMVVMVLVYVERYSSTHGVVVVAAASLVGPLSVTENFGYARESVGSPSDGITEVLIVSEPVSSSLLAQELMSLGRL